MRAAKKLLSIPNKGKQEKSPPQDFKLRHHPNLASFVSECDIIYVGGGSTNNMLAVWRASGMDVLLRKAWENGAVLSGVSAGAICWFEHATTDSWGPLVPMSCLGWLPGSCSPHYDGEPDRRPCFHKFIREKRLSGGYGLNDGAALHFIGKKLLRAIASRPTARAYDVRPKAGKVIEEALPIKYLGSAKAN